MQFKYLTTLYELENYSLANPCLVFAPLCSLSLDKCVALKSAKIKGDAYAAFCSSFLCITSFMEFFPAISSCFRFPKIWSYFSSFEATGLSLGYHSFRQLLRNCLKAGADVVIRPPSFVPLLSGIMDLCYPLSDVLNSNFMYFVLFSGYLQWKFLLFHCGQKEKSQIVI